MHDKSNIKTCTAQLPYVITTQFGWVLSKLPNKPKPMGKVYQPKWQPEAIVFAAAHNRREIFVGYPTFKSPDADVCLYLIDSGLTRKENEWFMQGEPSGYQVMGNDYYGRNEQIILPDGTSCNVTDVYGWNQIERGLR